MLYTPTYGGAAIFGLAVKIVQRPQTCAAQTDAFFGVPGTLSLFGGTRERTFDVSGVLYDESFDAVIADELVYYPNTPVSYVDGIARVLVDTSGVAWYNVVYRGDYSRTGDPRPATWATGDGTDSGWVIPYRAVFIGLA